MGAELEERKIYCCLGSLTCQVYFNPCYGCLFDDIRVQLLANWESLSFISGWKVPVPCFWLLGVLANTACLKAKGKEDRISLDLGNGL